MSAVACVLLAVMFMSAPDESVDVQAAAMISADADRAGVSGVVQEGPAAAERKGAVVTSVSSDFDRRKGVVLFEGDVVVRYGDDYTMCSDRLFMFLTKSNELARVVALGNVSITNETRVGTCEMATYRRRKQEIEMFWNGRDVPARLVERGDDASELEGTRIKFWLDTEQVEVENSSVDVKEEGKEKVL